MADVKVDLAGRSYQVRVDRGLIADFANQCGDLLRKKRVPIVTDANVRAAWGDALEASLLAAGKEPRWLVHEAGESAKSWDGLSRTVEWLLAEEVERGDHIVALGGGVIGDLTGFAASMLKRGCSFIQVPTTLLAQVDSSVGGKTAINVAAGKNLVGAFHQPSLVLADTNALSTLSPREMRCGFAEVIKYGILGDREFFEWCESNVAGILSHLPRTLEYAVTTSVQAKARIVAQDERETSGARALLNLGHTFGHALEAETGYSDRLLHGEAVAIGMALAARYSVRRGLMDQREAERIATAIGISDLRTDIWRLEGTCTGEQLVAHMLHDKKMDAGTLPFILLRGIGEAFVDNEVDLADVAEFLNEELTAD
ncbi:3-dehydroquinate synthase [Aurantiacibacter sp. D1-12]|uniref:3-dehydroquinate synthase n=1 Tax=Aurantiacibacter sp. D1-12 TaxID=2993658 RepID=UPI00237D032A|nr:3-dehydroquinate synthase [Aurantiacibacter sp. D1-12]MDE1466519.1 3-dehydroquinate synthase [Aurantiacibacter sp. D1-12]